MNEAHVVTGRALADPPGGEAHALGFKPADGSGEVVHPETEMVERRLVHPRPRLWIHRLHEIDLDLVRGDAQAQDGLIDVLGRAGVLAARLHAE